MVSWKTIDEFPKYEVSDDGRVRRADSKRYLKPFKHKKGYLLVKLYKTSTKHKTINVHILVLETFLCKRPKNMQCNHKDGIKANNSLSNLEWCTNSYNQKHAYKLGLHKPRDLRGEKNNIAKLTEIDVYKIKRLLSKGVYHKKIAKMFGVSQTAITDINLGRTWSHLKKER